MSEDTFLGNNTNQTEGDASSSPPSSPAPSPSIAEQSAANEGVQGPEAPGGGAGAEPPESPSTPSDGLEARPETAEGYGLAELLAREETDPGFISAMSETMHQAGLSKVQAQKLAGAYQAHYNANRQAAVEAHQREVAEAEQSLTPEEKENCRRGFRFLGLDNTEAAAIEMYWGVKKAARMFAKIGQALGEDKRVDGTASGGFTGSPEAARNRIAELTADPAFSKRYLEGEPAAVRQMNDLFKKAAEAN